MALPFDPPVQLSPLPSPPTSPISPRTGLTRIRIKASRRSASISNIPPTPGSEGHVERMRSISPSMCRDVSADPDTPGSETRTFALASPTANAVASKRRQSSIAYYTSFSPAPWSPRPQLNRTPPSGIDEPVVANGMENASKRSSLVLSSRSPSTRESMSSLGATGGREREPLTLVEKHADLLHFIAQKERRCLELRDQLLAHEKELAELKHKWEYIINRGHDPLPNLPLTAGLGGAALDGLKEGVRIIAAGFSDFGGVIQEFESIDHDPSKPEPHTHLPRDNISANAKRTGSGHLSLNSCSVQESMHASERVLEEGEKTTIATAPSLARAGSLSSRMHKRASRIINKEPTTPTSASVSSPAQSPESTNLDMGMSLVLAPSPTLVPPLLSALPAVSVMSAPKSQMVGSTHGPVPVTAGPMSSWMDSMGKKLSQLQKSQTFSKGQKRASSLLSGVSSTINAALSPGPTATTPAPVPTSISTLTAPCILSPTMSAASTRSSLITPQSPSGSQSESRPYPSYKFMADWLDDDEEQTVHAGGVMIPDSRPHPHTPSSPRGMRTAVEHGEVAVTSSFDDDWNW